MINVTDSQNSPVTTQNRHHPRQAQAARSLRVRDHEIQIFPNEPWCLRW
jgi:hypothetical protein